MMYCKKVNVLSELLYLKAKGEFGQFIATTFSIKPIKHKRSPEQQFPKFTEKHDLEN